MADKDYSKLKQFVEAALDNPAHPVFALGFRHHPALQYYELNVRTLGAIKPEQFFAENEGNPYRWTPKLEAVMALCEQAAAEPEPVTDEVAALKKQVADLTAKVETLRVSAAPEPPPAAEA